eukprot:RCo030262
MLKSWPGSVGLEGELRAASPASGGPTVAAALSLTHPAMSTGLKSSALPALKRTVDATPLAGAPHRLPALRVPRGPNGDGLQRAMARSSSTMGRADRRLL